jgi:glycosyltransferase involved in cell wall biosynthesis
MEDARRMKVFPDNKMSGSSPLVSVIVPVYNRYPMLCEAVGSILCQTFRNFELIVVDDGSADPSAQITAKGLEANVEATVKAAAHLPASGTTHAAGSSRRSGLSLLSPPSFRYIELEHTGMPGAVRNRGAKAARGRYLAFLDSDDLWLPQKLELQTALMLANPSRRISHTRELWLRDGKTVSQASQKHTRSGNLFDDSLIKCIIGPSTVMIERDLFLESGGFREDLEIGEDYELWLKITSMHPIAYIDQPLTVKRAGHSDQLTSKYGYIEHFRIKALRDLVDSSFFHGNDLQSAAAELSRKCSIYAVGARKRGKFMEADEYKALSELYKKDV